MRSNSSRLLAIPCSSSIISNDYDDDDEYRAPILWTEHNAHFSLANLTGLVAGWPSLVWLAGWLGRNVDKSHRPSPATLLAGWVAVLYNNINKWKSDFTLTGWNE